MRGRGLERALLLKLEDLESRGTLKGAEKVVTALRPPSGERGPRCLLDGQGEKEFLKMNSNSYLGLERHPEVLRAGERAARAFGSGPGAVRFISGTCHPHRELEKRLALFHGREEAMIFSSAYGAVIGILPPLVTPETVVVSDELNHNCIINALRISRPARKAVCRHLDMAELEKTLRDHSTGARRALVVTDGVFSMRGDHAPLVEIAGISRRLSEFYEEGVLTIVDDSHGVGASGVTGRGTEEVTGATADILVGTLGKALGVNGGYAVSSKTIVSYLRETAPSYIYSNPITPAEAAAAARALDILDSPEGREGLGRLRSLTALFEEGLRKLGWETLPGPHPIVPLMVRNTATTAALVDFLFEGGILVTGLNYPVVPKGSEELRFQISASHTEGDIAFVLKTLQAFPGP
jgi:glycine C-acetyltransferase